MSGADERRTPRVQARRAFDVIGAAVGLVLTAPLFGGSAAVIRMVMGKPVFFRQQRAGLHGQPFVLVKFRTMRPPAPGEEEADKDYVRLTRLGRFLRATSIDELPSLWNVLRGEMALVGPRPLPIRYVARYSAQQARRLEVKPGLTGLAQISGRNRLSWDEKFELDKMYVDQRSFSLDARILALTVLRVLRRDGIDQGQETTMPEFGGPADQALGSVRNGRRG